MGGSFKLVSGKQVVGILMEKGSQTFSSASVSEATSICCQPNHFVHKSKLNTWTSKKEMCIKSALNNLCCD